MTGGSVGGWAGGSGGLAATGGGSGDSNEVIAGPAQPASNRANGVKNKFANRAGLAGRLLSMDEKLAAFAGY
jgi:hypothetical protein